MSHSYSNSSFVTYNIFNKEIQATLSLYTKRDALQKTWVFALSHLIGNVIGCSESISADNRESHTHRMYKQMMNIHTHTLYCICQWCANSSQRFIMVAKRHTAPTLFVGWYAFICTHLLTCKLVFSFHIICNTPTLIFKSISRAFCKETTAKNRNCLHEAVQKQMITNNKRASLDFSATSEGGSCLCSW